MSIMRAATACLVALVLLPRPPAAQARLTVEVRGEPVQPGSVLELVVRGRTGDADPQGTAFDRPLAFVPAEAPFTWRTLVGVDVAQTPGPVPFQVDVAAGGTRTSAVTGTITVTPRAFTTRRLRVASQYIDPAPAEVERILAEAARLDAIFATVTRPAFSGPFVAPVPGSPGSNFGTRSIFNGEPRSPHAGVDFRGAVGRPIAAPGAGRVVLAEPLFFTGNTVIVDHGLGLFSLLAHLSRIEVTPDQDVARGDTVGRLGATGRVTGPHLHWTVRLGTARVDPMRLLALLGEPGGARTR